MRLATIGLLLGIAAFVGVSLAAWHLPQPVALVYLSCSPAAAIGAPWLGVKSLEWIPAHYSGRHR